MYSENDFRYYSELWHHGILNQKWGVRNGPPYPLNQETHREVVKGYGSAKGVSKRLSSRQTVVTATFKSTDLPKKMKPMSRLQDAKATNPNFKSIGGPAYAQNCANCTVAYELRRRGYDVKANPVKSLQSAQYLLDMFDKPDIYDVDPVKSIKDPYDRAKRSYEKIEKRILKQGEGARGSLLISWDEWSGHAVSYEVSKGKLVLIDGQSGKVYSNPFEDMVQYSDGEISYMRLDNVDFNPTKVKKAVSA